MIVRPHALGLRLVTQEDHAHLAGELAARLREAPGPRGALVAAARLHDNGWREADAAPTLDTGTGAPHTYRSLPPQGYVDVWARGIDRAIAVDPLVGLLVGLHGLRFFEGSPDAAKRAFLGERRVEQERLRAHAGDDALAHVGAQAEWVRFLDGLSLSLVGELPDAWNAEVAGARYEVERVRAGQTRVRPFPFDAPLRLRVPARRVAQVRYQDERELRDAVHAAERETLECLVDAG